MPVFTEKTAYSTDTTRGCNPKYNCDQIRVMIRLAPMFSWGSSYRDSSPLIEALVIHHMEAKMKVRSRLVKALVTGVLRLGMSCSPFLRQGLSSSLFTLPRRLEMRGGISYKIGCIICLRNATRHGGANLKQGRMAFKYRYRKATLKVFVILYKTRLSISYIEQSIDMPRMSSLYSRWNLSK